MSARYRARVGALGGLAPVLLTLTVFDASLLASSFTWVVAVSYAVRAAAMAGVGAVAAWLQDGETSQQKLFQIGMASPAMFALVITGAAASHASAGLSLVTPVHAAQETATLSVHEPSLLQQSAIGLLGRRPDLKNWILLAGERDTEAQARQSARALAGRWPWLPSPVVLHAPGGRWLVSVGGQMTEQFAHDTMTKAAAAPGGPVPLSLLNVRDVLTEEVK